VLQTLKAMGILYAATCEIPKKKYYWG